MGGFIAALPLRSSPIPAERFASACAAAPFRGVAHASLRPRLALASFGDSPLCDTAVFHGALYNRGDLQRTLGTGRVDDAALIAAAFDRWRERCVDHLVGEFAFVVWDELDRRLFCARDRLGMRPVYYHSSAHGFVLASDLLHVLAFSDETPPVNEGMVAEHLADAVTTWDETVYSGVFRLPPGHALWVDAGGATRRMRYWNPADVAEDSGRSDDDYAEELRHLFLEAVKCRLPADDRVGIYFSGGIDSSAVAGAAMALRPAQAPIAFSLAFGDDPELNELRYIRDVSDWCRMQSVVTQSRDPDVRPAAAYNRDPLDNLRDFAADAWKRGIRQHGVRVVLTGRGGDEAFFGSQYHYADMLKRGRIGAALRQWRDDAVAIGTPPAVGDFVRYGVWPVLPAGIRRVAGPLARAAAGDRIVPPWIDPAFARRVSLRDRLRPASASSRPSNVIRDEIIRAGYELGWKCYGRDVAEREAAEHGLDERHPFTDQRVVEFALRLPDDQRWRGTLTRFVVRRALHDLLPPSLRSRGTSGDGAVRVIAGVEGMGGQALVERLTIADAGWVRRDVLLSMYDRTRAAYAQEGIVLGVEAHALWAIGGTELWFRRARSGRYTAQHATAR